MTTQHANKTQNRTNSSSQPPRKSANRAAKPVALEPISARQRREVAPSEPGFISLAQQFNWKLLIVYLLSLALTGAMSYALVNNDSVQSAKKDIAMLERIYIGSGKNFALVQATAKGNPNLEAVTRFVGIPHDDRQIAYELRTKRLDGNTNNIAWKMVGLVTIVFTLMALTINHYLNTLVISRIKRVTKAVTAISYGESGSEMRSKGVRDEIAQLIASTERVRNALNYAQRELGEEA